MAAKRQDKLFICCHFWMKALRKTVQNDTNKWPFLQFWNCGNTSEQNTPNRPELSGLVRVIDWNRLWPPPPGSVVSPIEGMAVLPFLTALPHFSYMLKGHSHLLEGCQMCLNYIPEEAAGFRW